jgi:hypothetical protein
MIKDIIISITITLVVAALLAVCANYIFNYDLIKSFVVCIIIQIFGFYMWNSALQLVLRSRLEREETIRIEQYETQGIEVNCAHCNSLNFIPVRVNDDNQFVCTECDKPNSVYLDITIAPKSDITNRDILSISSFIKDKVDATNKLK